MSVQALSRAWDTRGLRPTDKLTLLLLADIADDRDRCEPSLAWIAANIGSTERVVASALKRLVAAGLLTPLAPVGYRLNLPGTHGSEDP